MDPLFLSYYLLLLLHPLYTRHTVPGHLTIARRPTINAYRFHAHRDKYGVARGTECRRAPLVPGTNTIFKAPSGENMWWMPRDMYFFFFFQSDLISTNARSTTIRRYREDRRKEEGKRGEGKEENESVSRNGISLWRRDTSTVKSFDSQLSWNTYITPLNLEISIGRIDTPIIILNPRTERIPFDSRIFNDGSRWARMNRVICLNVNNIIGIYLNTRLYKRMKQNWKQRRREIRNYMERIRIGSVADLPNRRYFFDGGWSSGRRILSTHRSGWPGKRISRSRLIHARGDAVGRWKFQSAISIVTRGEARSRRTAKRLSISCKSTTGIAGRGAPRPVRARVSLACY